MKKLLYSGAAIAIRSSKVRCPLYLVSILSLLSAMGLVAQDAHAGRLTDTSAVVSGQGSDGGSGIGGTRLRVCGSPLLAGRSPHPQAGTPDPRDRREPVRAYHLVNPDYWLPSISNTFHARDIFAPAAAHLAASSPSSSAVMGK